MVQDDELKGQLCIGHDVKEDFLTPQEILALPEDAENADGLKKDYRWKSRHYVQSDPTKYRVILGGDETSQEPVKMLQVDPNSVQNGNGPRANNQQNVPVVGGANQVSPLSNPLPNAGANGANDAPNTRVEDISLFPIMYGLLLVISLCCVGTLLMMCCCGYYFAKDIMSGKVVGIESIGSVDSV